MRRLPHSVLASRGPLGVALSLLLAACAVTPPGRPQAGIDPSARVPLAEHRAWVDHVERHVGRFWTVPVADVSGIDGFYCRADVRASPSGEILETRIERSCGSAALDSSLEAAVRASSPIPVPKRAGLLQDRLSLLFAKSPMQGPGRRRLEDVQQVFVAQSAAFESFFQRTSRGEWGKVTVQFTIAPDGSVTACEVAATDFADATFNTGVLALVKQMEFGAQDVAPFTYPNYPILFVWR